MPIIEQVPSEASLSQGDILLGIQLFATKRCEGDGGGEPTRVGGRICLVVSRPCVAAHKPYVTVAAIDKVRSGIPRDVRSLDQVLGFLNALRDGTGSPDLFYLGELPGESGRFAARLDSLHSMETPPPGCKHYAFLNEHRIGRLSIEFARDLHVRLFCAFACLGFDDIRWLSDPDLQWVLEQGRGELANATQILQEKKAAESKKSFEGQSFPQNEIHKAEVQVADIERKLAPYESERVRRSEQ